MFDGAAARICVQRVAAFPIVLWPDRARRKAAAAIGTDIVEDGLNAGTAEGAFKGANHRVRGTGRKRRVAIFAGRS